MPGSLTAWIPRSPTARIPRALAERIQNALAARTMGQDRPSDVLLVVGLMVGLLALDRVTGVMTSLDADALHDRWLLAAAAGRGIQPLIWVAVAVAWGALWLLRPGSMAATWSTLEKGTVLRWMTAPTILLCMWMGSLYPWNFVAGQAHWPDRLLIVVLGLGALARPVMVLPFVIEVKVVVEQTLFPFNSVMARNIWSLPLIVLLIVVAAHLLFVVSGRRSIATVVLELGAVVAAAHRRLLRWFLAAWVLFHVTTLVLTGYFFLPWMLVELVLLAVLVNPRLTGWTSANDTWARAALAVAATAAAPLLFHPTGLTWFDAPVSYGYRVDVVGTDGRTYHVANAAFAPLDHELSFLRLQLTPTVPASGAYGAVGTRAESERLAAVESFSDLDAIEEVQPPSTLRAESEAFLLAFFDHCNRPGESPWLLDRHAPSLFLTTASEPEYHRGDPIERMDVTLLTRIHRPEGLRERLVPVLTIERGPDGRGTVTARAEDLNGE